jgi:hypothetical protein
MAAIAHLVAPGTHALTAIDNSNIGTAVTDLKLRAFSDSGICRLLLTIIYVFVAYLAGCVRSGPSGSAPAICRGTPRRQARRVPSEGIRRRRADTGIRHALLAIMMLGATHGILRAHALTSITDANIATAATAWVNNPVAATGTYGAIGDWDTSAVTIMNGIFKDKHTFNDDISKWNTASVTDMSEVFSYGPSANFMSFNQNIGSWNVASVTTMYRMFY